MEEVVLTRAGAAAAQIDRSNARFVEADRSHARDEPCVIGMPDPNSGDIGEKITDERSVFHDLLRQNRSLDQIMPPALRNFPTDGAYPCADPTD
jgi:hypothetical protein